ncbi:hypothetical protein SAMN05216403_1344 [Nitrosospira multiformis ATCC 25196]|uniref:Uncharacterized protein n=1 Tax=Nitrosospira multiformis (strain ATCC 25196 / NCIMB 11849 / C 71) TaxID=323848 RepID=A0A1H5XPJ8_NITMU|nr:hypothetical protein SAMN05216411_12710 [Nitrosospira multiformis]SEG13357.1 hypothetical protein SAMN05216403_1344 [Nitrosospira multiformis ATCC 25196]
MMISENLARLKICCKNSERAKGLQESTTGFCVEAVINGRSESIYIAWQGNRNYTRRNRNEDP